MSTFMIRSFTIKDLERFSGIKAHTIRMWELRYNIIKPGRASSNHRQYSLQEVKEILHLALLTKHGCRISVAAALSPYELEQKVQVIEAEEGRHQAAIIDLLLHMYAMDAKGFESALERCFLTWSHDVVLRHIIYPFLIKTKIIWRGHRLDEEHFVVTAIRRKIIVAIDALPSVESSPTVLLFLPDQTQLDLALLYANYLLKQEGIKVIYMGNDISTANLMAYMKSAEPDYLYTYLPQKNNFPLAKVSASLDELLPHTKLIITTYPDAITTVSKFNNIIYSDYDKAIKSIVSSGVELSADI